MKVVYGHTDSIYVTVDSIEQGKEICKELNSHVQELFPNVLGLDEHPVQLEFEKYFRALGVGTTKSRNAGLITWKDGWDLETPEFVMTGFTAKRVSETPLAKEIQSTALKLWVSETSESEITQYCRGIFNDVKQGRIDLKSIVKRRRYNADRFKVKCPTCKQKYNILDMRETTKNGYCSHCHSEDSYPTPITQFTTLEGKKPTFGDSIAGTIFWSSTVQGKHKPINDSIFFLKVNNPTQTWTHPLTGKTRKVEWVSAPSMELLRGLIDSGFKPDYDYYSDVVSKKVKPIYLAMNWNQSGITLDERQRTLDEWF